MQLLKIKTTPIDYEINIEGARLECANSESAKLDLKQNNIKIENHTESIKVRADSSAFRKSIGMRTIAQVAQEIPAKTQQTINKTSSDYVNQGNSISEGVPIGQYMKQKMLDGIKFANIGTITPEPVDLSWEPASVKHSVKKANVEADYTNAEQKMEFIPSSYSLEVKQLAKVEIEYIGGFQYVPKSSDPNYEEK